MKMQRCGVPEFRLPRTTDLCYPSIYFGVTSYNEAVGAP